ncbi:hypothetical protein F5Y15DRAFT_174139 [Xylariaceae sp. FL0016]|nr:hypothetical protein F5Y15DRAFT_174139 [Xylariaceae sp. FL0016]
MTVDLPSTTTTPAPSTTTTTTTTTDQRRFWLLTSPRTASNLLIRILNLEEQNVRETYHGGYFFFPSLRARIGLLDTPPAQWTSAQREAVYQGSVASFDTLQDYLDDARRDGQKVFVKEHCFFINNLYHEMQYMHGADSVEGEPQVLPARGVPNPTRSPNNLTVMPDEFLQTWHPTFLIRHPAMAFPSLYRTCLASIKIDGVGRARAEPYEVETTMQWVRSLYDFYAAYFAAQGEPSWPLVIDADDVMNRPEVVAKYAATVGLDPAKLRYSWDKATPEQLGKMNKAEQRMLSSISDSVGVDKSKLAGSIDLDVEAAKWRTEFGEEGGRKLEKWVRDAMPDYEFLYAKRITAD